MDDARERIRAELASALIDAGFSDDAVRQSVECFDRVSALYTIGIMSTDIVPADSMPQTVREYVACKLLEGRSRSTAQLYATVLRKLFETVRKPPEAISTNDVRMYLYQLETAGNVKPQTLETYRGVIKYYFDWLAENGYVTKNPCTAIKPIRYERPHKQAMERIDLVMVQDACETPRERAIVDLLYSTGCRISELAGAKISDLNFDKRELHVLGKGSKHRTTWINDRALISVRKYIDSREDDSPYLLVSEIKPHEKMTTSGIGKALEKIIKRVPGGTSVKVTPHVFRHTSATLALKSGMPVTQVQRFLGHESISTTMQYVDVNDSDVSASHVKYVV